MKRKHGTRGLRPHDPGRAARSLRNVELGGPVIDTPDGKIQFAAGVDIQRDVIAQLEDPNGRPALPIAGPGPNGTRWRDNGHRIVEDEPPKPGCAVCSWLGFCCKGCRT